MPRIVSEIVDCYPFRRSAGHAEVLMLKRAEGSFMGATWHSVHGRIEAGETAWQAALRELREETSITPARFWQLESVNTFYMARDDCIMLCPAFAAEVSDNAAVQLNAENTDFRWEPLDLAEHAFIWPGQRAALREIADCILPNRPAARFLEIAI